MADVEAAETKRRVKTNFGEQSWFLLDAKDGIEMM